MNNVSQMKFLRYTERRTLREIGEMFGISGERVRQRTGARKAGRNNRSQSEIEKTNAREQVRLTFAAEHPELTTEELAGELGLKNTVHAARYWRGKRHYIPNKGYEIEEKVSQILKEKGIPHLLTNSHPVDMVLMDGRTVEIKSRFKPQENPCSDDFYFFPMGAERKGKPMADIYIFVIVTTLEMDLFIVPKEELPEAKAFGFVWPSSSMRRPRTSKFDPRSFHNNFDVLR